ncbi:MAG: glycosyltransferase family 39 protein [Chromatiales bacterium]|nr:glycosyltransferase family 39 protein [Chromatiales bacterium]
MNKQNLAFDLRWHRTLWIVLWAVATGTAMLFVPLIPIDETRYASVAWEMWTHGQFVLPTINGMPYHHKPPLLFWMIHLGWALFGVNEWWLRFMPSLFALASLFLTHRLAAQLWPQRPAIAAFAPARRRASGWWLVFAPLLMFDVALTCWMLLAVSGLFDAHQRGGLRGWVILCIATLLGLLTKGPVVLLYILIPGVLMPFLISAPERGIHRWRWFAALTVSVAIAVAGSLLWAIPAAMLGGPQFAKGLFWEQTKGRIEGIGFAHSAPWWWYLPFLPIALFPWVWWPPLWRALRAGVGGGSAPDPVLRLLVIWAGVVFVAFSVISGKRIHYLLPLTPVLALLAARMLDTAVVRGVSGLRQWPLVIVLVAMAVMFAIFPGMQPQYPGWPEWVAHLPISISVVLVLGAVLLMLPLRQLAIEKRVLQVACVSVVLFSLVKMQAFEQARLSYDLHPVSEFLAQSERQQMPIAHMDAYHGQYHFIGRMLVPFDVISRVTAAKWAELHPNGLIISYPRQKPTQAPYPRVIYPYRGRWVAVWAASDVIECPQCVLSEISHGEQLPSEP